MSNKGTAKYDWPEIKEDYLVSEIIEVEQFLRKFYAIDSNKPLNGAFTKNTKGWRKDKEQFQRELTESKMQKIKDNPDVQDFINLLITAKQNAIKKVALLIGNGGNKIKERDIPYIQKGIEICNLELGLATNLTRTELTGKDGGAIESNSNVTVEFINAKKLNNET